VADPEEQHHVGMPFLGFAVLLHDRRRTIWFRGLDRKRAPAWDRARRLPSGSLRLRWLWLWRIFFTVEPEHLRQRCFLVFRRKAEELEAAFSRVLPQGHMRQRLHGAGRVPLECC